MSGTTTAAKLLHDGTATTALPHIGSSSLLPASPSTDSLMSTETPRSAASVLDWIQHLSFLPDFTEHPKPKKKPDAAKPKPSSAASSVICIPDTEPTTDASPSTSTMSILSLSNCRNEQKQKQQEQEVEEDQQDEVTFWSDFVAGGLAGSASVIVGHPLDSIKVRIQTSRAGANINMWTAVTQFGGPSSLFRGMGPPLSSAALINAMVFASYGVGSRVWDTHVLATDPDRYAHLHHDPWQKALVCGSFAGLVQCVLICPMEHIKCRLQVQHGKGSADNNFRGPTQAIRHILQDHGIARLYQGWWSTVWREVPAFGLYFAIYDYIKDKTHSFLAHQAGHDQPDDGTPYPQHSHTWIASAFAGGISGATTWGIVYPVDVIKTHIQTAALTTPRSQLTMRQVATDMIQQHGWRHLFRGMTITILRAFPVNGTIFPVYEFALQQMAQLNSSN